MGSAGPAPTPSPPPTPSPTTYAKPSTTSTHQDRTNLSQLGYYSGSTSRTVNVQVIADPAGRLIWASPALPGARRDAGAAGEHGIPDAQAEAGVTAFADTAYCGLGPAIRAPHRRSRHDRGTGKFARRELSAGPKAVNSAHSALRAPGERANAELKNWRILRKLRSSPAHAGLLVDAVQTLIINPAAM
jgi:hypothetical protein